MSGAATTNMIKCCDEPWLVEAWADNTRYCQSCGKLVPKRTNRTNDDGRPKVVEEGKATTIDSF